jgi:hypothetical protein
MTPAASCSRVAMRRETLSFSAILRGDHSYTLDHSGSWWRSHPRQMRAARLQWCIRSGSRVDLRVGVRDSVAFSLLLTPRLLRKVRQELTLVVRPGVSFVGADDLLHE